MNQPQNETLGPALQDKDAHSPQFLKPAPMFRIYGKHSSRKTFGPMDLNAGSVVKNLIFASLLTKEQADKFMAREAPRNTDWTFEVRPC